MKPTPIQVIVQHRTYSVIKGTTIYNNCVYITRPIYFQVKMKNCGTNYKQMVDPMAIISTNYRKESD